MTKQRLAGKTALVTAAGQGIGRATAELFASEGATVLATDINGDLLAGVAGCRTRRLDVRDPEEIAAAISDAGPIDILFNCAGYVHSGTILECEESTWNFSFDINVTSMYRLIRAALPGMLERGRGSIVNMSSIAGLIDIRPQNHIAYSTAKAGVIQLSKVLASEWARHNVRVNAIAPGYVATDMTRSVSQNQFLDIWKSLIPTGRLMSVDEIAYAVLFLASPASSSVTGQVLVADSGYTVW